jgi:hypothetical protein
MNPLSRRGWMGSLVRPAHGASLSSSWTVPAGATPPTADAPGTRVHDVRRYGAKGDGATLDTAAVQAAIEESGHAAGAGRGGGAGAGEGARMRWTRALAVARALASVGAAAAETPRGGAGEPWRPLFNGRDLSGWDTWLGIPHPSVQGLDRPRNAEGKYTEPLGLNVDPKHVFTVVSTDGAPAIRISGEIFGALTSRDEFDDFHVRLELKWGEKKWPPKAEVVRDSGLLYYAVGEQGGADNRTWMRSLESVPERLRPLMRHRITVADVAMTLEEASCARSLSPSCPRCPRPRRAPR